MELLRVGNLADEPLAAAAQFHSDVLPHVSSLLARSKGDLALVFAPADHTHHGWRLAAVQELARAHSPKRVNAIAGQHEEAIAAAADYLARAPGVTGQLLPVDGTGAAAMLYPRR
ncbi:Rossmann fold domain-containing protein [Novosphingobium sp. M1R2S20]|uniref:Rossmann fold domain-containing protein n=1 Tax=Novosphingobium rhizovicinum TaxID=3228928 RepID=A0ABV3RD84_9SPHN